MTYNVLFTFQSRQDLFEIYKYVAWNDSTAKADKLKNQLKLKCLSLVEFPNRGHKLPELEYSESNDYLEIHYKPYRIIYKIIDKTVFIYCILDGRRDLKDLLNKRLLR